MFNRSGIGLPLRPEGVGMRKSIFAATVVVAAALAASALAISVGSGWDDTFNRAGPDLGSDWAAACSTANSPGGDCSGSWAINNTGASNYVTGPQTCAHYNRAATYVTATDVDDTQAQKMKESVLITGKTNPGTC